MMVDRPQGGRWLRRLLSCIRYDEVLVLQGAPLLGAIFAIGTLNSDNVVTMLLLAAGSCLLVAHVFVLNDWAGVDHDLRDTSRSESVFLNRGIRRNEMRSLSLALLFVSLVLFGLIGSVTLILGVMIAIASALYSAPTFHMKGVPVVNSALHLVSGLLHFLLGYSAFGVVDERGLCIGCFFAAVFTAGHLTQEVRDFEADLRNGIKTNAVKFGKLRSFVASFLLFTLANVLLIVLAIRGTVPGVLVFVSGLSVCHFYWSLCAIRAGLSFESVQSLQKRYRALYAGIGAIMVLAVLST
jgi:4-hydroxybenzoate polyprenyltransferase